MLRSCIIAFWLIFLPAIARAVPPVAAFEVSRTSCTAPCAVFFNAFDGDGTNDTSDADLTGTNAAFHELEYLWDFGDPTSGVWSKTTDEPRNLAYGPLAAHVYDKAGTYTVTLTVTDAAGSSDVTTTTITVSDFTAAQTVCISRTTDHAGCPAGATQRSNQTGEWGDILNTEINTNGFRRVLFRAGQTWTETSTGDGFYFNVNGPGMVGAYGSGTRPVLSCATCNANNRALMRFGNIDDWRIVGIQTEGDTTNQSVEQFLLDAFTTTARTTNILFYDVVSTPNSFERGFGNIVPTSWTNEESADEFIFIVDCDWQDYGNSAGDITVSGRLNGLAILGSVLYDIQDGEHIIRIFHGNRGVVHASRLGGQAPTKTAITIRSGDAGCGGGSFGDNEFSDFWVFDSNIIDMTTNWNVQACMACNGSSAAECRDQVFLRNVCRHDATFGTDELHYCYTSSNSAGSATIERLTAKNNLCYYDRGPHPTTSTAGETCIDLNSNSWAWNNSMAVMRDDSVTIRLARFAAQCDNGVIWAPNATNVTIQAAANCTSATNNSELSGTATPFVSSDPGSTKANWEPHATSPLLNVGTNTAPVRYDARGYDRRPASGIPGSALDVGAVERGAQPPAGGGGFLPGGPVGGGILSMILRQY